MKAVTKFKNLIDKKRPAAFDETLGKNVRTLHLTDGSVTSEPALHKSRSVDLSDRRHVEAALTAEGVHHDVFPASNRLPSTRVDSSVVMIDSLGTKGQEASPRHRSYISASSEVQELEHSDSRSASSGEKGQAHDPLSEEPLFLGIGTGGDSSLELPQNETVAESPTAAEFNIYDLAYQQEVERIRSEHGHRATVYLNRRVDNMKEYKTDASIVDDPKTSEVKGMPHGGWGQLIDRLREKENEQQPSDAA
jgi:[calcium/calmodulin-dependent protein kinase] kinase